MKRFEQFIHRAAGAGGMLVLLSPVLINAGINRWFLLAAILILVSPEVFGAEDWHDRGPRWERKRKVDEIERGEM